MAVILNIEMPECCDLCLFGCWSNLHQTAGCYLMSDTQMFDDFSTEYKTRRSVNCPMEEHKPMVGRKKGKWIEKSDGLYEFYECDKCGKQVNDISKFCPNCGADMRTSK